MNQAHTNQNRLFVACILALVSVSFGFIIRAFLIDEWKGIFHLSDTQIGSIQGAGLFPQALTIILFSLIVDRVGYGSIAAFAWIGHIVSAVVTITATGYDGLYWGTFIFALANGAVEAVINPVTATLYPNNKTHYLNILHAGWPGGLVIGGVLAILLGSFGGPDAWKYKVALYLIPTTIYGLTMLGQKFPKQERVAAGVSYIDMLKEFGMAGCLIVSIFGAYALYEILRVFDYELPNAFMIAIPLITTAVFGFYVRSFGRPMFIFLLLVMVLLATTELGTDSWIADMMKPVLKASGDNAGKYVLIYTSSIMFVLRFCAGPIVHRISPLGLLAGCAAVASGGLYWLANSQTAGVVFLAATCYGFGKTFFWPTTLGVVSEQFPKGGALTLNAIAAVGMISVGVLGNPILGAMKDQQLDQQLQLESPELHASLVGKTETKYGLVYNSLDASKKEQLAGAERDQVDRAEAVSNQRILAKVAILPVIMCLCYVGLLLYFRSRGGYSQVHIGTSTSEPEALTR